MLGNSLEPQLVHTELSEQSIDKEKSRHLKFGVWSGMVCRQVGLANRPRSSLLFCSYGTLTRYVVFHVNSIHSVQCVSEFLS